MSTFVRFSDPIIPTTYAAGLVDLVAALGVSRPRVLAGTAITEAMLSSPRARLSLQQLQRLVRNALSETGDPGLGLRLGARLKVSDLGMLGYAAMTQSDLGAALEVTAKYQRVLLSHLELRLHERGERIAIELAPEVPLGPFEQFVMEAAAGGLVGLCRFLTGAALPELELRFGYPEPEYANRYHEEFGGNVSFGWTSTELSFAAGARAAPVLFASEATARMAEELCESALSPALHKEGVVRSVKALLQQHSRPFPDVRSVAQSLRTSERSLRRALSEHGTSYQVLLDEIRMQRALDYLHSTSMPVEDIARNIGFGSSRSFRRAFRRWTGKSPSELRVA